MVKKFFEKLKERLKKNPSQDDEFSSEASAEVREGNIDLDELPPHPENEEIAAAEFSEEEVPAEHTAVREVTPPPTDEEQVEFQQQEDATQFSNANSELDSDELTGSTRIEPKVIINDEDLNPPESDQIEQLPLSDPEIDKSPWFKNIQNKFTNKVNTLTWKMNRPKDGSTIAFKLPKEPTFRIDELFKDFFSTKNRALIHRIFLLALVITLPYTVGKMLALVTAPTTDSKKVKSPPHLPIAVAETQNYKEVFDQVKAINLFNAINSEMAGGHKKGPFICEKSDKRTALPIKLVNTIVLQDSIKSIAAVQVRGESGSITLREGDPVESVGQISKIERMRILIKNMETGECEFAESDDKIKDQMAKKFTVLNPAAGRKLLNKQQDGIRNVGNHFYIKKALRDESMKDMNNILTQARAVQIRNPDGSYSFKMTEIVAGSLYSKLNIQDGDIISGINGKKIENINELMNMFGKIKDVNNLSLTFTRQGQEQTQDYEFE